MWSWLLALTIALSLSCREREKKEENKSLSSDAKGAQVEVETPKGEKPPGFLTSQDLDGFGIEFTATKEDLVATLNDQSELYNHLADEDDATDACVNEAVQYKMSATKTVLTLDGTGDIAKCYESSGMDISKASVRVQMKVTCDNKDLSSYDGKPFEGLDIFKICPGGNGYYLDNMTMSIDMKVGEDISSHSIVLGSMFLADKEPCIFNLNKDVIKKKCETFYYSSFNEKKIFQINVEGSGDNLYYSKGFITGMVNDWVGSISYKGPTTPATYVFHRSNNDEKVEGKLQPKMSLTKSEMGFPVIRSPLFH